MAKNKATAFVPKNPNNYGGAWGFQTSKGFALSIRFRKAPGKNQRFVLLPNSYQKEGKNQPDYNVYLKTETEKGA